MAAFGPIPAARVPIFAATSLTLQTVSGCLVRADSVGIASLRLRFDVTFQLREYPHVLLTEGPYDQELRNLQQAGYLDREIESADDACRAFRTCLRPLRQILFTSSASEELSTARSIDVFELSMKRHQIAMHRI